MKPRDPRRDQTPRRRRRNRWLLLLLALPPLVFAGLIAPRSQCPRAGGREQRDGDLVLPGLQADDEPFHYIPDDEVYALDLDPREVRFGLLEGGTGNRTPLKTSQRWPTSPGRCTSAISITAGRRSPFPSVI